MSINSFLNQTVSFKLIIVVGGFWLMVAAAAVLYFFGGFKEGFEAGIVGLGTALNYSIGDGVTTSWENPDKVKDHITKNKDSRDIRDINYNKVDEKYDLYANLEHNVTGPIPLPDEELVFFDKNIFSPECCPSNYSSADGCLCAAPEQMKYLNERGGNRTLVGEY
jgi:hypothetical protein